MNIIWKSGVKNGELEDRIRKGAEKLELHLESDDLNNLDDLELILEPYKEIIEIVHTPIKEKYTLEGLHSDENRGMIVKTFELAQRLSDGKRMIDVVLHQTTSLNRLKIWGMYDTILAQLHFLLKKYPNIIINLENLTVMGQNTADEVEVDGGVVVRSSYFSEIFKVCKALREDLKTDRIGLVWDVCHGVSSERLLKHLIDIDYIEDLSLESHIKLYIPYLNIIHLANTRGYGTGEGHGAPFDREGEDKELEYIISLINKYKYDKKVTLEVWEHNYTDVKHCVYLDKQIKDILKK